MTKREILTAVSAVVLTIALIVGVSSAAAAGYGSAEDPLISMSYLEDVFIPDMMQKVEDTFAGLQERYYAMFDSRLSQYTQQVQEMLTAPAAGTEDVFTVLTLKKGQTLTGTTGTELLIRSGSAVCYGESATILSDVTTGQVLGDMGTTLSENHMYVITLTGGGIYIASEEATLLVRGDYVIG